MTCKSIEPRDRVDVKRIIEMAADEMWRWVVCADGRTEMPTLEEKTRLVEVLYETAGWGNDCILFGNGTGSLGEVPFYNYWLLEKRLPGEKARVNMVMRGFHSQNEIERHMGSEVMDHFVVLEVFVKVGRHYEKTIFEYPAMIGQDDSSKRRGIRKLNLMGVCEFNSGREIYCGLSASLRGVEDFLSLLLHDLCDILENGPTLVPMMEEKGLLLYGQEFYRYVCWSDGKCGGYGIQDQNGKFYNRDTGEFTAEEMVCVDIEHDDLEEIE